MSNTVFANGREISCKASDGKSIASFPDVCLSPPTPPAGPIPLPYPNTGMASDTTEGSQTVKLEGQEAMLQDKSYFKQSSGDEAATKAQGMGVVTHTIQGKVYFTSWSMDVKFEGEGVVRHLDMTTHNHNPPPGNTPPWVHTASQLFAPGGKCAKMDDLKLTPYKDGCPDSPGGGRQTGHHLIPGRCMNNVSQYSHGDAPTICVTFGNQHQGSHRACHAVFDPVEADHFDKGKPFPYDKARGTAAESAGGAVGRDLSPKEQECVAAQLDSYYKASPPNGPGLKDSDPLRASGNPGKVIPSKSAPGTF